MASPPPRLLADTMLGRLARWLRVLGLDVLYDPRLHDAELVDRAVVEGRTILTRDRRLILRRRARNHLLVASERLEDQLGQVIRELNIELEPRRMFGRCLRCNAPLASISADIARDRVPPYVAATQGRFRYCPDCDHVYWAATHVQRMRRHLAHMGLTD